MYEVSGDKLELLASNDNSIGVLLSPLFLGLGGACLGALNAASDGLWDLLVIGGIIFLVLGIGSAGLSFWKMRGLKGRIAEIKRPEGGA